MDGKILTRFSKDASTWYDKWLDSETYHIEPPTVEIIRIPVVGMAHQGVSEDMLLDDQLVLEADPENKFDPKAIKVLYLGEQVGWIPRRSTAIIHSKVFVQDGDDLSVLPKLISGRELFVYVVAER